MTENLIKKLKKYEKSLKDILNDYREEYKSELASGFYDFNLKSAIRAYETCLELLYRQFPDLKRNQNDRT